MSCAPLFASQAWWFLVKIYILGRMWKTLLTVLSERKIFPSDIVPILCFFTAAVCVCVCVFLCMCFIKYPRDGVACFCFMFINIQKGGSSASLVQTHFECLVVFRLQGSLPPGSLGVFSSFILSFCTIILLFIQPHNKIVWEQKWIPQRTFAELKNF